MATILLIYSKYNFGVRFACPMETQICSVQLMAYIATSHDCTVGGLNMTVYYEVSRQYTRARLSPET